MGMRKYYHGLGVAVVLLSALVQAMPVCTQMTPTYIYDGLMTWQRGIDGSTWQEWTFDTEQNPASPEQFYNPYGNPAIQLTGDDGSVPFAWNNGVWMGDPVVATITVPNNPVANPSKTIWFEMVYKAVDSILPSVSVGKGYEVVQTSFNDRPYNCDDWRIMTIEWTIMPNPELETFTFALAGTGGYVTSVSIDTLCAVPLPSTAMLVSVGLGMIRMMRMRIR
jgi:hypothetical protein